MPAFAAGGEVNFSTLGTSAASYVVTSKGTQADEENEGQEHGVAHLVDNP